jgi:N-acetyl-gamma-glutamyl-phosphate reductase
MRVAVIGASGYAGGELLRLIAGHPRFTLALATADGSAGRLAGEVHAHLAADPHFADLVLDPISVLDSPGVLSAAGCDLAFLALPAGQSGSASARIPTDVKIVDLGPDFRLSDPAAWQRHYGGDHAGHWVTGLPELPGARDAITAADRVAVPGCYATAVILALGPLVSAGLVRTDDLVIVAASGTSGAGRALRTELLATEVMGSATVYQAGGAHRHVPEIEQALGATGVSFTPLLAPMPRGILATCTARLALPDADTAALRTVLDKSYGDERFVRLLPDGMWPATAAVAGSNAVHIQAAADARTGRAVVVAAIDNLGKGAAGQAIQNANLMLGLAEDAGLTGIGVAP